jgi:hypothetical protein
VDSNNRINSNCRYTSNSRKANDSREAKTAGKPKTAGTSITAGDANNSRDAKTRGNISRRRDVNNSWDPTAGTPGRLTGQQKESLIRRADSCTGDNWNSRDVNNNRDAKTKTSVKEGMLTKVWMPQQELQGG